MTLRCRVEMRRALGFEEPQGLAFDIALALAVTVLVGMFFVGLIQARRCVQQRAAQADWAYQRLPPLTRELELRFRSQFDASVEILTA